MQQTPEMIREQRFKSKLSGFDKEEVSAFLMDIAEDLEELVEENSLLKSELESLRNKQKDLEDIFLSAKQFSDEKIRKAEAEAGIIVDEAQKQASALEEQARLKIEQAEEKGREVLEEAQQKAQDILLDIEQKKSAIERDIIELKAKRINLLSEIRTVLNSCQNWIREMGDVDSQ